MYMYQKGRNDYRKLLLAYFISEVEMAVKATTH